MDPFKPKKENRLYEIDKDRILEEAKKKLNKPRKEGPTFEEGEGPKMPSDRPIDLEFPRV